jgi:hypothetical protein
VSIRIGKAREEMETGIIRNLLLHKISFMRLRESKCRIRTRIKCIKTHIQALKVELIVEIKHPLVVKHFT